MKANASVVVASQRRKRRALERGLQPASGSTGLWPVAPGNLPSVSGSATVSVAPVGVPPTGPATRQPERADTVVRRANVFGVPPKTAGETPALPSNSRKARRCFAALNSFTLEN